MITLLTDFGTEDGYVGAIKGVISSGTPESRIVDISHEIQPYQIRQAAFVLNNYAFTFPPDTIHLLVVDPGVGGGREGIVLTADNQYFVGPNNGIFSYICKQGEFKAYRIEEKKIGTDISPTFHGRDVFAPAAVKIACGEEPHRFCKPISQVHSFIEPLEQLGKGEYRLKIIHIDHFGNLILNYTRDDWQNMGSPADITIKVNHSFIRGIKKTFGEVTEHQLVVTWDSRGFLQIAQNMGNAATLLGRKEGDPILLKINES